VDRVKNASEGSAARVKRTVFLGTINFNIVKYTPYHYAVLVLHQFLISTRSLQPVEHAPRMQDMYYQLCEARSPTARCLEKHRRTTHCSRDHPAQAR
jgi:hypothetical protein